MATVYVAPAPTGDDTRTYAQAQNPATPWATPTKVDASAVTGDTVNFAAGTYALVSISFAKAFTFVGAALSNGLPTTIFDGGGLSTEWAFYGTWVFTRIGFKNGAPAPNVFLLHITGVANVTLTNCLFKSINATNGYPFRADNSSGLVLTLNRCVFDDVYGLGAGYSFIFFLWACPSTTMAVNNTTISIKSNTVSGPGLYVLNVGNGTTGTYDFANCIIYNSSPLGVVWWLAGTATYCDLYQVTSPPAGTGNITSDPLFVDAANANFNLRPTSPCLGTGIIV